MTVHQLAFQDFDFPHCMTPWWMPDGALTQRWVPYGMPRFRPTVAMSTFYLYRRDHMTGEIVGPCGTGFCVIKPSAIPGAIAHAYGITAHHVIQEAGASIIRVNRRARVMQGKSSVITVTTKLVEFEPHEWQFVPRGDDIAAIDITDVIGDQDDLLSGVPEDGFAHLGFVHEAKLTLGEDVFMVGLFTGNPGEQFNHVAVRFGNISQLASETHPVMQGNGIVRASHIVDMHSRPGFSGSPVFVYRTPWNDLSAIDERGNFAPNMNAPHVAFIKLLGIHSGQFKERMDAERIEAYNEPFRDGDRLAVQSSMAIVAPAWNIPELLNMQHFKDQRAAREKQQRPRSTMSPEAAKAELADANPAHKEDFTALLNEAAQPPAKGD